MLTVATPTSLEPGSSIDKGSFISIPSLTIGVVILEVWESSNNLIWKSYVPSSGISSIISLVNLNIMVPFSVGVTRDTTGVSVASFWITICPYVALTSSITFSPLFFLYFTPSYITVKRISTSLSPLNNTMFLSIVAVSLFTVTLRSVNITVSSPPS